MRGGTRALGVALAQKAYDTHESSARAGLKSLLKNVLSIGSPDAEAEKTRDFNFVICALSHRIAGI